MRANVTPGLPAHAHHGVQFYDDDAYLAEIVGDFLAEGMAAGDRLLVVATPAHRAAFRAALAARGVDVEQGGVAWLDARETLARFMVQDLPDPELFQAAVAPMLRGASGHTRAYGEMVDLLWDDGKPNAALRLEAMWNKLEEARELTLLCGYAMQRFADPLDGERFGELCELHTHVQPCESHARLDRAEARLREIAALQQRVRTLELEVARRRRLEDELKDFVENAAIGLHWVGPDGTILWANRAELELLGYSSDEYVGRHIGDFHVEPGVAADILARLVRAGNLRDFEARLRCKDGSVKRVLMSSNVLWRDGKFVHTRCLMRDITARHQAETELRLAEERFRLLISATSQVVWTATPDGCVVDVSPSWIAFTGQSASQAAGTGWLDAVHADDRARVQLVRQHALASGIPFEVEYRVRRPDGDHSWAVACGTPVVDAQGAVREWVGTLTDISERKRVEEERARLLEREQAARDQAEAANRVKDEFIAVISHELRTPLSAIMGWAEALRAGELDATEQTRALDTILRSARAQAQLVDEILDLSRIIAGKLRLQTRRLDLDEVARASVEAARAAAEARGVELELRTAPALALVNGDAGRLRQVLGHLLANAIKFTPRGGRVEVAVEPRGPLASVIVRDTGHGIRAEFMPHLFDRFRQADASTTRASGGLGLGLAIVRHLVELHGGQVAATSPGEELGAEFTISLPRLPEPEGGGASSAGEAKRAGVLGGIRVLLVDDVADVRELVGLVLTRKGATVRTAGSAAEALAALPEFGPHVLVSDIGLPGEDGYELMRKIRALPIEAGGLVPAVALTAYAGVEDARRAMLAGFQIHVPKPVELARLTQVISDLARWSRRDARRGEA